MNCGDVIKQLNSYLDGELDETLRWELMAHLEECTDCRVVVDTTRKTIELYCNSEPLPLPSDVRARLNQALARKLTGPSS
ncbi:MAG: zf-HC2 domain-containing protein [Acidobacteria bacterium]|nr:zf-HC2 domain-containing protein [Acidobacteriota bacterium]